MEKENNPIETEENKEPIEAEAAAGEKKGKKKKEAQAVVFNYDPHEEENSPAKLAQLDFERQAAQAEAGQEETTYGIWGWLWKIWRKFVPEREPVKVNKKKYCLLGLFLGFCGVHRFYQKSYRLGVFYAVLFWSGFPFIMAVLDIFYAAFLPADEDGNIVL